MANWKYLIVRKDKHDEYPVLVPYDEEELKQFEEELLNKFPSLTKAGRRPHNEKVLLMSEQLRKIFGPKGAPAWTGLVDLCPPLEEQKNVGG